MIAIWGIAITPTALATAIATVIGALALWRAGSVKAWKETAQGRAQRIEDLSAELAELRAELKIPERIEGIINAMREAAEHQDHAATQRSKNAVRAITRWFDQRLEAIDVRHDAQHEALLEVLHAIDRELMTNQALLRGQDPPEHRWPPSR